MTGSIGKPGIAVLCYESRVLPFRIVLHHAVDFLCLSGRKIFLRIEAGPGGGQSLASQPFLNPGNATGEVMSRVEESGVEIRQPGLEPGPFSCSLFSPFDFIQEGDGGTGANGPLPEKPADDATRRISPGEGREEVLKNGVVIAGVKGEIHSSTFGNGSDDLESGVAVERGDFDRDGGIQLSEASPEIPSISPPSDGCLQVKTEERQDPADLPAMVQEGVIVCLPHRGKAHENRIVAESPGRFRLADRLGRGTADTRHKHDGMLLRDLLARSLGTRGENRFVKPVFRIADFELRRVDTNSESSRTCIEIIPDEGALVAKRPFPVRVQREWHRRDDQTAGQLFPQP